MAVYLGSNQVGETISIESGGTGQEDKIIDKTISGSYENSTVTQVGDYAFYGCQSLTTINFTNVTSIGRMGVASCSSLTTVSFPVATNIGSNAFSFCKSLTTINFPNVTSIGSSAFITCIALTTANFPVATNIETAAFAYCSSLTTASFPAATSIGSYAFRSCLNLLSLYLLGSSIPTLASTNAFTSTPISNYTTSTSGVHGSIYVPASLYSSYKTATNWTAYSSRFVSV